MHRSRTGSVGSPAPTRVAVGNLQSCRQDRLGPYRCKRQVARTCDLASNQMEDQHWFRCNAGVWIGLLAVVVDTKLGHLREEMNQIETTSIVALSDPGFGNIVSAFRHPGTHARDVKLGTRQTHVPDSHLDSRQERSVEEGSDGTSSERRLECKVASFGDRPLQEPLSLVPCSAIRFPLGEAGIGGKDLARGVVGVEIRSTCPEERRPGDAALPGAVGTRKNVDAGAPGRFSLVSGQPRPRPFPVASGTPRMLPSSRPVLSASASARIEHRTPRSRCRALVPRHAQER